jgi:2,4-dienoyl-CoA reductase-like NADH-dependent reductase (Old Yellow Enzyme family)
MADAINHATQRLEALYRRWPRSGAGLLLSGNIQVDRWRLVRPGNIVIHDERVQEQPARLAAAGTSEGARF